MVEDTIRLLDHLKIRKAHVVGYSMGGRITFSLLGYHPERLRTAVIGGFGWVPSDDNSYNTVHEQLAESLEHDNSLEPLILWLNPVGAPRPTQEQISLINKIFLSLGNDPKALAAIQRNPAPSPTRAQLRANKVPVLSLTGELDPLKSYVDPLISFMPDLKVVVIPKANHANTPGVPEFIENLRHFLQEHSAPASEPH